MRAAILLAAGGSRRFGRGDKLLARLNGRPLLLHALDGALASGVRRVIVVVPSAGGKVGRAIGRCPRVERVVARRHRDGLAASLTAGLAALRPIEREALIFLADMPFARMPTGARLGAGRDAVRPLHRGAPGHPLLVRSAVAARARLRGDQGLAAKLHAIGTLRGAVGNLIDVDTPATLRRLRANFGRPGKRTAPASS